MKGEVGLKIYGLIVYIDLKRLKFIKELYLRLHGYIVYCVYP